MRLDHSRICTRDSEVETGNYYLYTEGNLECKVKLVHANQNKEGTYLHLKVIAKPQSSPIALGEEFEVFAGFTIIGTEKWWYLHDQDLVCF